MLKKFTNFLFSLKFGIILFLIIAVYSIIGTVIPQGMDVGFYLEQYRTFGSLMVFLQFDNVYSSVIYLAIVFVFIINLLGCTLNILPTQLKRMKETYAPKVGKNSTNLYEDGMDLENVKEVLKKRKFKIIDTEDGAYALKHSIGHLGSSVTHLGIMVIILGAVIGNMFVIDGYITLIPGERADFNEYGYSFYLDDFYLELREDGTVEQYISEVIVHEEGKEAREEKLWVNKPLNMNGMYFYQSNYGWASKMQVKSKEGQVLQENIYKGSRHEFYLPEDLTIYLYGFFPDFSMDHHGNPITISQEINNPAYAVVLYNHTGYVDSYIVEPGEAIEYNDIRIEFVDSVLYTGLTYRQDFGYYPVLIGSIILTLGILLSFYFYPKYILLSPTSIVPLTRQNVWGFTVNIKRILKEENKGKEES
ncbi:MAG: cytochrome c biogenesis protein ResB [Tissierellia bacterium]|nr:cytochrome c biogenesis protein ResB [Tissierellia bacterium]